jgi:retron-type reverse transcriptase
MLKAVAHHTDQRWILLYVERWLQAPLAQPDGTLVERDRGTPQGSAISPVLANLFLQPGKPRGEVPDGRSFSAWLPSEPRGHLSMHVALQ